MQKAVGDHGSCQPKNDVRWSLHNTSSSGNACTISWDGQALDGRVMQHYMPVDEWQLCADRLQHLASAPHLRTGSPHSGSATKMSAPTMRTAYVCRSSCAGPRNTLPVQTSKRARCSGHVSTQPSSSPWSNGPLIWVQSSSTA